jgi:hypothetical protein
MAFVAAGHVVPASYSSRVQVLLNLLIPKFTCSDFVIGIARKHTCMQKWKLILSINLENRSFAVTVGSIKSRVAIKSCYLKVLGSKKLSFTLCNFNLPGLF